MLLVLVSWLVILVDLQRAQEDPNRLFLQARPPRIDRGRGYRGQLTVPQAFAGLKVSPSIYRWMLGLYGGTGFYRFIMDDIEINSLILLSSFFSNGAATSRMGVTVAEAADPSLERRGT